jgi:hypothetical protein
MGSSRNRNSTRRAPKTRSVKLTPTPPRKPVASLGTAASPSIRRNPADDTEDLFAILGELVHATCLIVTAKRSLEHREAAWDEIATLEAGIKMLRRVDVALNDVADGRPSRITPDEDQDATDDAEGDE